MPLTGQKVGRIFLLCAMMLAGAGSLFLFRSYLEPILIAALLGLVCHPLHERIKKALGGRNVLACFITCLLLTCVFLIPSLFGLLALLQQGANYSSNVMEWVSDGGVHKLMQSPFVVHAIEVLDGLLPAEQLTTDYIKQQVLGSASKVGAQLIGVSRDMVAGVFNLLLNLGLMVLVLFFMLRDYQALSDFFREAVPLARSQEDILISETAAVTRSVLVGNVATALLQGTAGGIAMWLSGFPGFFWGAMMALASFIPVVGTALIWVPAAAYLFFTGETSWGIFLVVWSAVVVGSIDNFVRPMFMAGSTNINGLVIFLSILGGLQVFGLLGLLYGPLIVSLTLVLYRMYLQEFSDFIEHQDGR